MENCFNQLFGFLIPSVMEFLDVSTITDPNDQEEQTIELNEDEVIISENTETKKTSVRQLEYLHAD